MRLELEYDFNSGRKIIDLKREFRAFSSALS